MEEFIAILSQYVPELMTISIGGVSIGAVIYLVTFIFKKLETFRKDPNVAALERRVGELVDNNRSLAEQNARLEKKLEDLSADIHHIYRGE